MSRLLLAIPVIFFVMLNLGHLGVATGLEEHTSYLIILNDDGSAIWRIRHVFPLPSDEDAKAFKEYIEKQRGGVEKLRENLTMWVAGIVEEASRNTGRSMTIRGVEVNVSITDTLSGKLGIIEIRFLWEGFASLSDSELSIGDVFIGGLYLLKDDSLTVRFPSSYSLRTVSPAPDELRDGEVLWRGKRNFGDREPMIVLSKTAQPIAENTSTIDNSKQLYNALMVVLPVAVIALLTTFVLRVRYRGYRGAREEIASIIEALRRHGGEATQSTIVRETNFSKAKVSIMLKVLEEEGRVVRERVGREKLVRLKK